MLFRSNDTATTEIYTLSLHDALPICGRYAYDRLAYEWAAALRGVVPTDGGKNARVV